MPRRSLHRSRSGPWSLRTGESHPSTPPETYRRRAGRLARNCGTHTEDQLGRTSQPHPRAMILLDTNVLIYGFDPSSPLHSWARSIIRSSLLGEGAAINPVILTEYLIGEQAPDSVIPRLNAFGIEILDLPAIIAPRMLHFWKIAASKLPHLGPKSRCPIFSSELMPPCSTCHSPPPMWAVTAPTSLSLHSSPPESQSGHRSSTPTRCSHTGSCVCINWLEFYRRDPGKTLATKDRAHANPARIRAPLLQPDRYRLRQSVP